MSGTSRAAHATLAALLGAVAACGGAGEGDSAADAPTRWVDLDEDGASAEVDCDDADDSVGPDAEERCLDGVDNDCDGLIDAGDPGCLPAGAPQSASAKTAASSAKRSAKRE
jgi:hypothetical protein